MRGAVLVLIAVLGALVAGFGLSRSTGRSSAGFGWTAYSPLSAEAYPVFLQPPWWALVSVVAGSAVFGAAVALLIVSRSHARRDGAAAVSARGGGARGRG